MLAGTTWSEALRDRRLPLRRLRNRSDKGERASPADEVARVPALGTLRERVNQPDAEADAGADPGRTPRLSAALPVARRAAHGRDDGQDERHADLAEQGAGVEPAVAPFRRVDDEHA